MSKLLRQMNEDRAMRDTAQTLFKADLEHLKSEMRSRGIGDRIADRVGETTADMLEEAADVASANKGILGALGVALALWFGRIPILVALGLAEANQELDNDGHAEPLSETDQFDGADDDD
ncbi:hypothetical protein [Altererythrobacter sp. ZODW24]|uniref:hypothetical protein n=1 Tax=Altererythrobacter sp. ZODW24 TaxID=2185142 RepID=UPI000DF77C32|nr:hypothetical protein [Altererythrobacter sp. ZODW24]